MSSPSSARVRLLAAGDVNKNYPSELAAAFLADLRRTGAQLRAARTKLTTAVQASGTSLTGLFGVGPVIAAAITGGDTKRLRYARRFDR